LAEDKKCAIYSNGASARVVRIVQSEANDKSATADSEEAPGQNARYANESGSTRQQGISTVNNGSSSLKPSAVMRGTLMKMMTIMESSFSTTKIFKAIAFREVFPE
jgi:hypothetical protein